MTYKLAVLGVSAVALAAAPAALAAPSDLSTQVVKARAATAKYATNLTLAKKNGYGIITRQVMNMGWHYMNPKIKGFNVKRPQILVYEKKGRTWQLGAVEWVFPTTPASPPLPGATYGSFPAACHYMDGTFVQAPNEQSCASTAPKTHAKFNFWHPDLVTMHFWVWYPNPDGIFMSENPLIAPFN